MFDMTPGQVAFYYRHFKHHPPGDYHTHELLAELIAIIATVLSSEQVSKYDIAPHLKTPAIERMLDRLKKEEEGATGDDDAEDRKAIAEAMQTRKLFEAQQRLKANGD